MPDLVEVIRQIDIEAVDSLIRLSPMTMPQQRKRISLSFIGHSMGGLVVVSAIRVLSDVFDPAAILTSLSGAPRRRATRRTEEGQVPGTIGHVFDLMRFKAHIPIYEHIKLLVLYVLSRINIHGGYFDGPVTQQLIYRLACLGFAETAAAYGGRDSLFVACAKHQIRVMPSERLVRNAKGGPERMDISATSRAA